MTISLTQEISFEKKGGGTNSALGKVTYASNLKPFYHITLSKNRRHVIQTFNVSLNFLRKTTSNSEHFKAQFLFIFIWVFFINMSTIQLKFLPEGFSVHQYDRDQQVSPKILNSPWYTISKTKSELSIILPSEFKLTDAPKKTEDGWRMLQIDAQMDFGLVGILARIVSPLKDVNIPVFVVSTYDTDYVMVKEDKLTEAIKVLNDQPNIVVTPGEPII